MAESRPVSFDVGPLRIVGDAYGDPSAPPVVLLHGGGQTRHAWGGTAAALAAHGHHAIAIDLRGHGDSGLGPGRATTASRRSHATCARSRASSRRVPRSWEPRSAASPP